MTRVKGLVVKTEDKHCLILTPEGEFRRFPLPAGRVEMGREIELEATRPIGILSRRRPLTLLVASLLLTFLGFQMFSGFLSPAVAYVSIDINPSLEMAVDASRRIIAVSAFDAEARDLVRALSLKGQPLARGLELILEAAVARGYLDPSRRAVVLAAVAPAEEGKDALVTSGELASAIDTGLQASGVAARIVVTPASPGSHQAARKEGLSLGKYVLGQAVRAAGEEMDAEELRKGIGEIETSKQLRLETVFQARKAMPEGASEHVEADQRELPPGKERSAEKGRPSAGSGQLEKFSQPPAVRDGGPVLPGGSLKGGQMEKKRSVEDADKAEVSTDKGKEDKGKEKNSKITDEPDGAKTKEQGKNWSPVEVKPEPEETGWTDALKMRDRLEHLIQGKSKGGVSKEQKSVRDTEPVIILPRF